MHLAVIGQATSDTEYTVVQRKTHQLGLNEKTSPQDGVM
jgi:hypothetical protein